MWDDSKVHMHDTFLDYEFGDISASRCSSNQVIRSLWKSQVCNIYLPRDDVVDEGRPCENARYQLPYRHFPGDEIPSDIWLPGFLFVPVRRAVRNPGSASNQE